MMSDDDDTLEENYARMGRAIDKILAIEGVDMHPDVDVEACYASDDHTTFGVKLVVDDGVFDDE